MASERSRFIIPSDDSDEDICWATASCDTDVYDTNIENKKHMVKLIE